MGVANLPRRRLLAAVALLVSLGSGCQWVRGTIWDLPPASPSNDEAQRWYENWQREREQNEDDRKAVAEERAKNESAFLAKNPGLRPPTGR